MQRADAVAPLLREILVDRRFNRAKVASVIGREQRGNDVDFFLFGGGVGSHKSDVFGRGSIIEVVFQGLDGSHIRGEELEAGLATAVIRVAREVIVPCNGGGELGVGVEDHRATHRFKGEGEGVNVNRI